MRRSSIDNDDEGLGGDDLPPREDVIGRGPLKGSGLCFCMVASSICNLFVFLRRPMALWKGGSRGRQPETFGSRFSNFHVKRGLSILQ